MPGLSLLGRVSRAGGLHRAPRGIFLPSGNQILSCEKPSFSPDTSFRGKDAHFGGDAILLPPAKPRHCRLELAFSSALVFLGLMSLEKKIELKRGENKAKLGAAAKPQVEHAHLLPKSAHPLCPTLSLARPPRETFLEHNFC